MGIFSSKPQIILDNWFAHAGLQSGAWRRFRLYVPEALSYCVTRGDGDHGRDWARCPKESSALQICLLLLLGVLEFIPPSPPHPLGPLLGGGQDEPVTKISNNTEVCKLARGGLPWPFRSSSRDEH